MSILVVFSSYVELLPVDGLAPVLVYLLEGFVHLLRVDLLALLQLDEVRLELERGDVAVLVPVHLLEDVLIFFWRREKSNVGISFGRHLGGGIDKSPITHLELFFGESRQQALHGGCCSLGRITVLGSRVLSFTALFYVIIDGLPLKNTFDELGRRKRKEAML